VEGPFPAGCGSLKKLAAVVALSLLGVVPAGVALAGPDDPGQGCKNSREGRNPNCQRETGPGNSDGNGSNGNNAPQQRPSQREVVLQVSRDGYTVTVTRDQSKPAQKEFDATVNTPPSDGSEISVQNTVETVKTTVEQVEDEVNSRLQRP
jgi:hypothetical protein